MIAVISKYKFEILFFFLFVIIRSFDLGTDMFNTDVFKWKARSYDFSTGVFTLDFEKTIQKYHPGVSLMWLGTAGIKVYNLYYDVFKGQVPADNDVNTVFELHRTQKFLIIVFLGIIFSFLFYGLKNVTNLAYALLVLLFLNLEPFYIALTRVMHLEGIMTTLMFTSFIWFLYYLKDTSKVKILVVSSFFGALAVLTKTTSVFILLFIGLILLLKNFKNIRSGELKFTLKIFISWFLLFSLFFVILWPAMLSHTLQALQTLYRGVVVIGIEREHIQLYFGRLVEDPGPLYYFVVLGLRTSFWILIGAISYLYFYKKEKDYEIKEFALYSLLFSLFYLIEISIPSKKLDRYVLPSLVGLVPIASASFYYVLRCLRKKYELSVNKFFLLFMGMFIPAIFTFGYVHPDYFSYYNPLFGGLRIGMNVIEPKWIFGQNELVKYFAEKMEYSQSEKFLPMDNFDEYLNSEAIRYRTVIAFPEKYYTQLWPFMNSIGARAAILDISEHAKNSGYVVYPVWDDRSEEEKRFNLFYLDTIKLRGVGVYNVYSKDLTF